MAKTTTPVPPGYPSVIPYLAVGDANALIAFLRTGFDATEVMRMAGPDGIVRHAEMRIRESVLMIGQSPRPRTAMLYLYIPDVDAAYALALRAPGARTVRAPTTDWYGDRVACVEDGQGNEFWMATHVEDLTQAELVARAAARPH
jgi:PhnB protein